MRPSAEGCKTLTSGDLRFGERGRLIISVQTKSKGVRIVLKSVFRSFVVASVLAVSAGAASATTVSLTYEGPTVQNYAGVDFTATPAGVTPYYDPAGAVGFKMSDVTPGGSVLGDFIAWCLDITHPLGKSGSHLYTITETPFSNSYGLDAAEKARVQSVFDANYGGVDVTDKYEAAGFQVALWNALYDTDVLAGAGVFAIKTAGYEAIVNQADAYLAAAAGYTGSRLWNLTFLESADQRKVRQNLVTATPVPVPAAAGLLLLALGGLAAAGRKRRAA